MKNENKVYFELLSVGERGTMVYVAQKILNDIGYGLEEDGFFSEKMLEAVKAFQIQSDNLSVSGVINYQTMKEMDEFSSELSNKMMKT